MKSSGNTLKNVAKCVKALLLFLRLVAILIVGAQALEIVR